MMKNLVIVLAFLGLVLQTSCTSKDSQPESEVAADYDSADLEKLEGDEALEIAGTDNMASDQLPEDALGETTTTIETTTTTTDSLPGDSLATTEQVDVATNTETMPADPFAESSSVTSEPPADTSTTIVDAPTTSTPDNTSMVESSTSTESTTTVTETEPAKPLPSLQKVATTPWSVGGTRYNTVYFARPGDTLSSISQKIYGTNKVAELKKGNPMFSGRGVKPGDKVYYNSPHRADDATKVITFYEDNGIAPETYVAKSGDNIRNVSKGLLGYDNAWKEVWASNSVDSKQGISEGTELRYWKDGSMAAAPAPRSEVAQSEPQTSALPPPPEMPPQDMGQPQDMAQAEMPPPPMPEPAMDMPPPPPPMDMAQSEPPPPPPPPEMAAPPHQASAEEAPTGMDSDTTMALGVVGLAAAGLALLIVMRKKRKQKELEQQGLDNTHVGT